MNYADRTLADLAVALPMATELFRKHRLDFCCGGKQTLRDACEQKNLNLTNLEKEIEALRPRRSSGPEAMNLGEMTEFIVERYHQDLRRRIPELMALAHKVEKVHSDHASCPRGLHGLLSEMNSELETHMAKEEQVLFPMIKSGSGHLAVMPIKVMTSEHDDHGRQLDQLHEITNDFGPPADACATWCALYAGLETLEQELMDHIHLENNILFPRALSSKQGA